MLKINNHQHVCCLLLVTSYENNPGGIVGCYIHRFPLTEENNYFEIKILDAGRRGMIYSPSR